MYLTSYSFKIISGWNRGHRDASVTVQYTEGQFPHTADGNGILGWRGGTVPCGGGGLKYGFLKLRTLFVGVQIDW